ncbi:MAG TPA: hypothetical protein ENK29_02480 [Chromatiales bacterium]|nr:hypothetical protein [Chromatiales bacterium]
MVDKNGRENGVFHISSEFHEEIPKWDVALEALARETCQHLERPLNQLDVRRLARQYAIRFDDIMITLFELVIHGKWVYLDETGKPREITREVLDGLYVNGRLEERDLVDFAGGWRPA